MKYEEYPHFFDSLTHLTEFLKREELIQSKGVKVYTTKGKLVDMDETESSNREYGTTMSSIPSVEPKGVTIASLDEIVMIEKEVHGRRIRKYIDEKTESMRSLIEVV